jgi:hypothetical protein
MAAELSKSEERRGTRRLMFAGAVIAAILGIAVVVWPFVFTSKLGTPITGANPATSPDLTLSRGTPAQRAAESEVGKNDPAGQEDATGGRARQIKQTSGPLQLNDNQREKVKQILAEAKAPKVNKADFEIMIGTAVPRQEPLQDIPPEITKVMNGYWGDEYVVVGDTMIIVDQHTRRIVAIVPKVA